MSKCPVCASRKGKRACRLHGAPVCPACCGSTRESASCQGCAFYQDPVRRYRDLPRYSAGDLEASDDLLMIAYPVESGICAIDRERGLSMRDTEAIAIFELLLDRWAFGDAPESLAPRIAALGCGDYFDGVERELAGRDRETVAKVLAAVHFVACRREAGGREHLNLLQSTAGRSRR